MTEVLNTNTVDPPGLRGIYKLCEFNGYLYAGGGEDNVLATLYRSATGAAGTWSICATFSGYNWVRGLVVWNNELWVGTKGNASLWHGDGTTFTKVSNWPVEAVFQAKELIPFNNKLYIGCVNTEAYSAKIYSYNGTTFTTELNFPTDHEIFHGDVANNCLYFSVRTSDTNGTGGAVVVKDSLGWREVFRDTGLEFNHIHWVKSGGNGRLYMSGSNLEGKDAVLYSAIINRTLRS